LWKSSEYARKFEFVRKSVQNRRRIAAECVRTRQCIDAVVCTRVGLAKVCLLVRTLLDKEHPHPLIVLTGDLNDGPGADFFEVRMSLCARVGGDRVHLRAGCVCYV
jgi:hypothetical protein